MKAYISCHPVYSTYHCDVMIVTFHSKWRKNKNNYEKKCTAEAVPKASQFPIEFLQNSGLIRFTRLLQQLHKIVSNVNSEEKEEELHRCNNLNPLHFHSRMVSQIEKKTHYMQQKLLLSKIALPKSTKKTDNTNSWVNNRIFFARMKNRSRWTRNTKNWKMIQNISKESNRAKANEQFLIPIRF